MTDFSVSGDVALRLFAAVVLGGVVGFEREVRGQPAGLRTHIAVCMGAALFGVISTLGFDEFRAVRETTNFQVDVTRVASQVVVGMGFLGAGLIIRQHGAVRNLTTAASVWTVAAVGLATGVGDVGSAGLATVITVGYLTALRPLRAWIDRSLARREMTLRISFEPSVQPAELVDALRPLGSTTLVAVEKHEGRLAVVIDFTPSAGADTVPVLDALARRPDIWSLEAI